MRQRLASTESQYNDAMQQQLAGILGVKPQHLQMQLTTTSPVISAAKLAAACLFRRRGQHV